MNSTKHQHVHFEGHKSKQYAAFTFKELTSCFHLIPAHNQLYSISNRT